MNIFLQIKNSIYNQDYYKNVVLNESLKQSIKYILKLSLILVLVLLIIFSFKIPGLITQGEKLVSTMARDFPEDLIISIKAGEVSINQPEPYVFGMPDYLQNDETTSLASNELNLLVINTTEDYSIDKFNEYQTLFLLAEKEIVAKKDDNRLEVFSLTKVKNVDIDKNWILEKESLFINKFLPWATALAIPFLYIALFIGFSLGALFLALWYALVVLLIFKLKKINLPYKKCYQIALHASTIVLILSLLNAYVPFFSNVIVKTFLLVIIILLNFQDQENFETQELTTNI
jgi:hypothetical protein